MLFIALPDYEIGQLFIDSIWIEFRHRLAHAEGVSAESSVNAVFCHFRYYAVGQALERIVSEVLSEHVIHHLKLVYVYEHHLIRHIRILAKLIAYSHEKVILVIYSGELVMAGDITLTKVPAKIPLSSVIRCFSTV